jgi:flagellar basal-body rod protein FlgF/flagellar basal-body rod protein FlgG
MFYGAYLSAEGAQAQSRRLEILANNLANVDTTGFKRDLAVVRARHAEEIDLGFDFPGSGTINNVGGGVRLVETETDFSPGPLSLTGQPTDVAIQGEGFFVVRKPEGDYLTRAGNFALRPTGELVTTEGYSVLDNDGNPMLIDTDLGPWNINSNGDIVQGDAVGQQLRLVTPRSLGDLVKAGENLFRPLADPLPVPPEARRVAQGYLEHSGVQPTLEMMDLITASRAFEANVNMIRNQDQMIGSLVGRLLRA